MNIRFRLALGIACICALSSCVDNEHSLFRPDKPDLVDPTLNLTKDDYSNIAKPKTDASFKAKTPSIPDLAPILAAPQPPKIATTKLVSISVTDDIPLKDVLLELARLADIDIEVDAGIRGGIVYRAKDRPFNEVIQSIADLAGLRYSMKDGVLRVERDTPVVEIYALNFLNMDRSSQNAVTINTNVLSGGGGGSSGGGGNSGGGSGGSSGGNGGLNSGSQTGITGKSDSDFWKKFDEGIKQILAYQPASLASQNNSISTNTTQAGAATASAAKGGTSTSQDTFYIINRQAGTLTVSANRRQQDLVARFVKEITRNASAQVLIEAKIVEVSLNQQFQSGIDWNNFGTGIFHFNSGTNGFSPITSKLTPGSSGSVFSVNASNRLGSLDLNFMINLLDEFGTVRTLASPRLHAINNQQAVLTYAENYVYFQVTSQQTVTTSTNGTSTTSPPTINSSVQTVPIGIILTLQPSINMETNEVTLEVRPTYSILVDTKVDPAAAFILAQQNITDDNLQNKVPVVAVREMDSIVKLKSGAVAVIGGYMEDIGASNDNGLPYLSSIPVAGNLFKGVDRERRVRELVILLKATVVDSNGYTQDADRSVYEKFIQDPRPLGF